MGYQCIDTYQEVIVSSIEEIYHIIQKYKTLKCYTNVVTGVANKI